MITGWPSELFIRSPTTRATMSVMPPAANGTMMVTGCDGNDWAPAVPIPGSATANAPKNASSLIPSSQGKLNALSWSMARGSDGAKGCRAGGLLLLHLDAVEADDRPPLVDFGLVEIVQRLRGQFGFVRNAHAERRNAFLHDRIGQRLDHRAVELVDDVFRRALRRPQTMPERNIHSGDAHLLHGRHIGQPR